MQITINIPDGKSLWLLVLLREIPDIKVQIVPDGDARNSDLAAMAGVWEEKMTMEEIDQRLLEQKEEWL